MNKKSQRNTFHAPTTQPVVAIAPSGTVALDGELPHSASNGVTAPEPLAAHDVLHAAMAQSDAGSATTAPDGEHGATAVSDPAPGDSAAPSDIAAQDATAQDPVSADPAPAKGDAKKAGKKKGQAAVPAPADPLADAVAPKEKAVKAVKEKFVACNFTLPQSEAAVLSAMKKTHQANGVNVKKSQLLRAALLHLADVDSTQLAHLLAQLPQPPVARKKKK